MTEKEKLERLEAQLAELENMTKFQLIAVEIRSFFNTVKTKIKLFYLLLTNKYLRDAYLETKYEIRKRKKEKR